MEPTPPKLSLVASFDDWITQSTDDMGVEGVLLDVAQKQEERRQRHQAVEHETEELRKKVAALEKDKAELKRNLAHTEEVLEKEVLLRVKREKELLETERQLQLIQEFIMSGNKRRNETLNFLAQVDKVEDSDTKLRGTQEPKGSVHSPSHVVHENDHHRIPRGKQRSVTGRLVEPASAKKKKSEGGQEDGD